jgi:hypothetical protein
MTQLFVPWFEASAAMLMRSAFFWDITHRRVVIVYHSTLPNIPEEGRSHFIPCQHALYCTLNAPARPRHTHGRARTHRHTHTHTHTHTYIYIYIYIYMRGYLCSQLNVELKLSLCTPLRYKQDAGTAPLILNLGTGWWWVINVTSTPLYSRGRNPRPPFDRRVYRPQSRFGLWKREKILSAMGIERFLGRPAHSLFSVPTALCRLPDSSRNRANVTSETAQQPSRSQAEAIEISTKKLVYV